jgi:hypothetical protein
MAANQQDHFQPITSLTHYVHRVFFIIELACKQVVSLIPVGQHCNCYDEYKPTADDENQNLFEISAKRRSLTVVLPLQR